jgi:hypothetical protein
MNQHKQKKSAMADQSKSMKESWINFSFDQLNKMSRVMGQVDDTRDLKCQKELDSFLMEQST